MLRKKAFLVASCEAEPVFEQVPFDEAGFGPASSKGTLWWSVPFDLNGRQDPSSFGDVLEA